MKLLKKTTATLLILIFLLGIFPPEIMPELIPDLTPTASAITVFGDISGHWAAGVINRWNNF